MLSADQSEVQMSIYKVLLSDLNLMYDTDLLKVIRI